MSGMKLTATSQFELCKTKRVFWRFGVCVPSIPLSLSHTRTHTHIHIYTQALSTSHFVQDTTNTAAVAAKLLHILSSLCVDYICTQDVGDNCDF